jgi:hypothetical protein
VRRPGHRERRGRTRDRTRTAAGRRLGDPRDFPPRRVAVVVFPVVDDQGVPGGDRQRRLPLAPIGSQVA